MNYKTCSICKKSLPATDEYFNKNRSRRDGLATRCKECRSLIRRESYAKNTKIISEYNRKWRRDNPDKYLNYLETKRNKYEESPDQHRIIVAQYYQDNKDDKKKQVSKWKKSNPNKCRQYEHRRRKRINYAGGDFTAEELEERIEEQGFMCFYCSYPLEDDYHADHFIPISKGGSNNIDNIVVACKSCNLSKNDKDPYEFMSSIGKNFVQVSHTLKRAS